MSGSGVLKEALLLSEVILSDLEMSAIPLTNIAMKVSRLARLVGDFDQQQIMVYEASGYPSGPEGIKADVWRLAELAGRVNIVKEGEGEKEVKTERANTESIEQIEIEMAGARERMAAAADGSISVSSANPYQTVQTPTGNAAERKNILTFLSQKSSLLSRRRSYIHNYVCGVYFELKFSSVPSDIFDRTRAKVDKKIGEIVPGAVKKFTSVYENLLSENDEDWSNAVHSCRRILQETADGVYPAREDKVVDVGNGKTKAIKLGVENYVNRLIAYVEENSDSSRFSEIVGSHMKYLGERLDAIFQAAQKGSHNVISSQDEADRYVIYTYLVIGDILQLKADVERSEAKSEGEAS
ncbi:hypothetical protein [Pseudomonas sp. NFX15]|uniref:AbiTii domain-containing protein n=1 Tax=Pseudomonas sp. NFX15 TaxID=2816958 RepID=UPI003B8BC6BD